MISVQHNSPPNSISHSKANGKMQASQTQTLTLCYIFKERQECIWGFDDDSELEDGPCERGMLLQASIRMPTIQEKVSNLPSCSQQVCSAEEVDRRRASSHAEKREGSNDYLSTAKRSGKYSPDGDPPVGFYEDEDMESSSGEEDQEKASFTKIRSDLPSCSQLACSAEEIDWKGSSSRAEKKGEGNGFSHHPTEGQNSSPGLAHRSSRVNSQQPTGVQDWSCRQIQPRAQAIPINRLNTDTTN